MSLEDEKKRLRAHARALRLSAHQAVGSFAPAGLKASFLSAMADMGFPRPGAVVAGYWPIDSEIDVRPLLLHLDRLGFACALPVVVEAGAPLLFRRWRPDSELGAGPLGTRQPAAEADRLIPEAVLLPLLAFDGRGCRLGQGGGYYDRTLLELRGGGPLLAVGIGFAGQRLEAVPHGPRDQRLDWVVTEQRAIETRDRDRSERR